MYMLVAHLAYGAHTCRHLRRQLNLESQFESSAKNPGPETPHVASTMSFGETSAVGRIFERVLPRDHLHRIDLLLESLQQHICGSQDVIPNQDTCVS